jgi:hypothetical protein
MLGIPRGPPRHQEDFYVNGRFGSRQIFDDRTNQVARFKTVTTKLGRGSLCARKLGFKNPLDLALDAQFERKVKC